MSHFQSTISPVYPNPKTLSLLILTLIIPRDTLTFALIRRVFLFFFKSHAEWDSEWCGHVQWG